MLSFCSAFYFMESKKPRIIGHSNPVATLKSRFISGIIGGGFYTVMLLMAKHFYDDSISTYKSIAFQAIVMGIFHGLMFDILMFTTPKSFANERPELMPDEFVEVEGLANRFKGMFSLGGKLYFTNQRIIFNANKMNFKPKPTSIKYNDIDQVSERKTAFVFNTGLRVTTKNGDFIDFVVNDRELWIWEFENAIRKYAS